MAVGLETVQTQGTAHATQEGRGCMPAPGRAGRAGHSELRAGGRRTLDRNKGSVVHVCICDFSQGRFGAMEGFKYKRVLFRLASYKDNCGLGKNRGNPWHQSEGL